MRRFIMLNSTATCFCLGVVAPLLAAPAPPNDPPPGVAGVSAANPAATCQADFHAFNGQLEKGGYWLGGSDYGYGYPVGGMGYGDGYFAGGYGDGYAAGGYALKDAPDYRNVRPGYEIRILLASANILAQNGQQQGCEDILDTTRAIYKLYVADMQERGLRPVDEPGWQQKGITAARPVTADHMSFRSDELLDTAVRNTKDESLGSVDDLVTNPETGKIAYLVVARGGIFGFDKKYVPVPWDAFKVTQGMKLLVLDTTKAAMETAPEVSHDAALTPAQFDQESQKVDAYWTAHLPVKAFN